METLEYKISINAPKHIVWNKMLSPETYQEWTSASWPGSFFKGVWQKGESIDFISFDGSGTRAFLKEVIYQQSIRSEHIAILQKGSEEDTTSDIAKTWIGITENYSFIEKNGGTELIIDIHAAPQWTEMFNSGYPAALAKLKEICEQD
jgi:ligand-binding SRPBCC domain-containing protein